MSEKLAEILGRIGSGTAPALESCRLIALWDKVVDERVKKHTDPVKVKNRILYIAASSPTWAQELTFLKKDIIRKFNEIAGRAAIRDIRFRWGECDG